MAAASIAPRPERGAHTLHHGDALAVMAALPDRSIDCILVDPPYGVSSAPWDSTIPLAPLWAQIARLLRNPDDPIVFFAAQPFTSALVMSNPKWFRYSWVWEKERGTGHLNAHRRPLRRHEDIVVFGKKPPRYYPQRVAGPPNHTRIPRDVAASGSLYGAYKLNASDTSGRKYPQSVLHFAGAPRQGRLHPTEKPQLLLKYLVETYTLPGETVLDFAMGSASTGIACVRAGRHFVGIDSDAAFVAVARARLAIDLPLAHRPTHEEHAA